MQTYRYPSTAPYGYRTKTPEPHALPAPRERSAASLLVSTVIGAVTAALLIAAPNTSLAADETVGITAAFGGTVRPGEVAVLTVTLTPPRGFHLYSMTRIPDGPLPLRITVGAAERLIPATPWYGDPPDVTVDPNFDKAVEHYDGEAPHRRAFRVAPQEPGALELRIEAVGQICTEGRCIRFESDAAARLTVESGAPRPERTAVPTLQGEPFPEERPPPARPRAALTGGPGSPMDAGLLAFIVIAFLAGVGALFTPCVFPMIPITVSFFSKFAKVSFRRSVTMAGVYTGSIVATFTLLGVLVSALFGAVGMQTLSASAGFNIFLTLLLVVFAFNLFGLFEIQMPGWLVDKAGEKERNLTGEDGSLARQAAGVFLMAVTFTLVSFTCTVGFIGWVLAEAAKGNWFYPAIGMLAFSVAFSIPFFFLAVFPSVANRLKGKGGDWMVAVKVALGFLELAGALKFLSNVDLLWQWGVVTRPLVLSLWAALFTGAGLYLLRIFNLPHSDAAARHIGPIRMTFALMFLALAVYAASAVRDTRSMGGWLDGWLPPAVYPGSEPPDEAHLEWIVDDISGGMQRARDANRPLFVDFTGYTCTNCRYMEGALFPREAVRRRLTQMVRVRAFTDCEQAVCAQQRAYQLERFDTAALPFYVIIDPRSDTVLATHPDMTRDVDAFVRFLEEGLSAFASPPPEPSLPPPPAESRSAPADAGVASPVPPPDRGPVLKEDGPAVDFTFPGLFTGAPTSLSELRGRWVFLNFWASWCAPCKEEITRVFPAALRSAPHVALITVAFDGPDTAPAARAFAKAAGLDHHVALRGGEDIAESGLAPHFNVSDNLPISYLIRPDGRIAWQHTGTLDTATLTAVFARTR